MRNIFNYVDRPSPIHSLTGATKLVCLVLWSLAAMLTYDTRFLMVLPLISFALFAVSKIKLRDVSFMLGFTAVFLLLNNVMIYIFSPRHGVELYGAESVLLGSGRYALTAQQLFYHFNLLLKYMSTIPIVLLFVCTTNPSEFAASLNRIGVRYTVAYSVALALRYIPDIQREYRDISQSQQARGIEMSKKESLVKRLKSAGAIIIPLILSSMDRIELISNAMELRGFGKGKKRTWYMGRKFNIADISAMAFCAILLFIALYLNKLNGGRFYNPFL